LIFMDKTEKALRKLTPKERKATRAILRKITQEQFEGLDIKRLKERDDIFRVRKGDIRIIYRKTDADIFILAIERRSEKTYKKF